MKSSSWIMPLFISLIITGLCSCEKEQLHTEQKLVGKTFSTQSLSLTFVSHDSVSFQTKNTLYILEGKSKYEINNDMIVINSPYGKRLEPNETTDSYILNFTGYLKNDRIDKATFAIIGPYEKEQYFGYEITLFME